MDPNEEKFERLRTMIQEEGEDDLTFEKLRKMNPEIFFKKEKLLEKKLGDKG